MPFLTGCTTIKVPAEFVYKEVETRNFTLASWQKVTNPAAPYKIYIEGDGYAFNARGKATQDQTPRGTLVRELAFGDDSQNVIYFARPCQYIKSPICSKRHWTTARFALEVINAEYEAIKNIADNNPVKTPDYVNMSLRDELQTRFDLDELNNLQQKYGVQQTSALKSQITASSPQSSYVQPISSQQPNSQPSTWDNTLRKAEQLTTAALDGLSLGWTDELEGAASAVGYGLASLNPQWDKTNESFWDAMKRGYVKGRDNRRQVLAQGLQENPTTTTITQMAGAYASPIKFFGYSKTTPLGIQNKLNNYDAVANGIIYGIGSGQDNWQNYAQQIGIGLVGNFAGNRFAAQAFGRAVNPLIRNAFSTASGEATGYVIDGIKNQYHNYNK